MRNDDDDDAKCASNENNNSSSCKTNNKFSLSDWLVLPTLVFSQFCGTSLWFAPNAVLSRVGTFAQHEGRVATLVSCVQIGFIIGTLSLTMLRASDRVSPPILFTIMTTMGSALNLLCITTTNFAVWALLRVLVGGCLAGVYPVGMKIAAIEYPTGLGARLGVLVGALTLGTAFPWLVRGIGEDVGLPFEVTLAAVSALAFIGAVVLAVVILPRDKFRRTGLGSETLRRLCGCCFRTSNDIVEEETKAREEEQKNIKRPSEEKVEELSITVSTRQHCGKEIVADLSVPLDMEADLNSIGRSIESDTTATDHGVMETFRVITASSPFRAAFVGYCGHMWELYAMWTFVPVLIDRYSEEIGGVIRGNESMTSFITIGIGFVSCSVTGIWSLVAGRNVFPGSAVAAMVNLIVSFGCCLVVPLYQRMSQGVFLFFLLVWGWSVVADSAQFSSLTAMNASKGLVGTSLTLTTCVGFSISVVSIQIIGAMIERGMDPGNAMAFLCIGPAIGVVRSYQEWPIHQLCHGE